MHIPFHLVIHRGLFEAQTYFTLSRNDSTFFRVARRSDVYFYRNRILDRRYRGCSTAPTEFITMRSQIKSPKPLKSKEFTPVPSIHRDEFSNSSSKLSPVPFDHPFGLEFEGSATH